MTNVPKFDAAGNIKKYTFRKYDHQTKQYTQVKEMVAVAKPINCKTLLNKQLTSKVGWGVTAALTLWDLKNLYKKYV